MKYLIMIMFGASSLAFAAEHGEGVSDIVPRTINFLIFFGLMYYLLAGKIKSFFADRQASVIAELDQIEERIREAKKAKEAAAKKVEEAKRIAEEIMGTIKKEIDMLLERESSATQRELEHLEKLKEEMQSVFRNKMVRAVVVDSLEEIININDMSDNNEELIKSLLRKVA